MAKIKMRSTSLSGDPNGTNLKFHFFPYAEGLVLRNNEQDVDFVTDGKSLYVCYIDGYQTHGSIQENGAGLLKIVSQGEPGKEGKPGQDGAAGAVPTIGAQFIDGAGEKKLALTVNGRTAAMTDDLTPPSWKPVVDGNILSWELTDDRYAPDSIDLMKLRPINERPILLRTNSDNTKRSDEVSGPANFIQWKYEGDEYWTNLISISELMNLALAGVSFWEATDGKWHFGHREVVRANYISDKNGRQIISNVRLGDVLFDAGEVPFPDNRLDIELINQRLDALEAGLVKSVSINGGNPNEPDLNGNVDLDLSAYAKKSEIPDTVDAYKKSESDARYQPKGDYVKGIKVNGGTTKYPDSNTGIVNLDVQTGGGADTSDCVKSVTINGERKTPVNGNVSFNIEVGDLGSFDVKLENNTLYKNLGNGWVACGSVSGGSGGGECDKCWSTQEILDLVEDVLQGRIPTNYLVPSDLDEYMKRSEVAATYATMAWVSDEIARVITGQAEVEYFRVFTLYTRYDSRTTEPNGPIANVWEWNSTTGEILTDTSNKSGWDNHPQNATPENPYLWMASATFSSKTHKEVKPSNASSAWTKVCLTGEPGANGSNGYNGTDGADGNGVEFIFTLVRDINDKSLVQRPVAPVGQGEDDIPEGWEDHPQGIGYYMPNDVTTVLSNLTNQETLFGLEMASMRTFDGESWSAYCEPFIWSMWGEDGVDGDGVEYIFFIADENSVDINTTTGKVSLPVATYFVPGTSPNFIPTTQQQVNDLGSSYQVSDWIQVADNNWTDNPSDVDAHQPFEFVAMRKYHDGTGWGPFCTPKLWSHYGGITVNPVTTTYEYGSTFYSPYKCYAFYRANETDGTSHTELSNYSVIYDFSVFGDQSNPNPTYTDLTAEQKALFYEHPEVYTKTMNGNTQVPITWHDTVPSGDGQLWLITAHIGDESDTSTDTGWTSPCRWGDKAGFNVEYSSDERGALVYANPSLINNHNMTFNDYTGTDEEREGSWEQAMLNAGYGVWSDTVQDPVYMATTVLVDGVWSNWTIAKIKGEKGNTGDIGPQGQNGSDGADGTDIEFVYFRTDNENHRPGMSPTAGTYDGQHKTSEDPYEDDFLPMATGSGFDLSDNELKIGNDFFWHDHPAGVNESLTCEWVGTRHTYYQNGQKLWSSFNIALWSKFGEKGRDGDGIEYVFWGLTETQANSINGSVYPTQQSTNSGVNSKNRTDSHSRHITDSEYLPAIVLPTDNDPIEAVDNNPGISTNKYVYASMRKYTYDSVSGTSKWGEFSEIKLWNEQNNSTLESIVLDITDDKHQILVDENGVIKNSDLQFRCNTSTMSLYKDLVLIGNGKIFVNDVLLAYDNPAGTGTNRMVVTNNTATVECNGVTASVIATSAYKNEDSNTSSINLRVTFQANTVLKDAFVIPITVVDVSELYSAVDSLSIVPVLDKGPELTHVPNVQKTSGEGTHDYGQTDLSFWGTPIYGTLEQVMPTEYWFGYDGKTPVNFKLTTANKTALRALDDGTALHRENFYFDRNGSQISSDTNYYFRIQINNSDYNDNLDPYRKWTSTGYVRLSSFDNNADEQTQNYPIDEMLFGIGVDGVCTDDATVYIVYPGKNGQPGQPGQPGVNGSYKKELYCLGSENEYDGNWVNTWESLGVTINTVISGGWSASKPTPTTLRPHIWMTRADVTIGQEGTQVCVWETPTRITPVDGNVTHTYEYLAGTIMRTSAWSAGVNDTTKYWDGNTRVITINGVENESSTDEGIKYLDVVSVTNTSNGVTKTRWFKCILNHTKTSSLVSPVDDDTRWAEFSIMSDAAFHDLLVENAAYIENLTSKQVVITDNGNIVAGMTSGTITGTDLEDEEVTPGNIRIWAGAITNGNLATAPFTVDNTGKLISDDAEITGEIHAESGSIDGTLTIGANGELVSSITTSEGVVQTTVSATEIKNSYTDNSTYAFETKIAEGKINVYNDFAGDKLRSQLGPDDLQFYSQEGSSGVTVTEAVTTPIIQNGVYAGSAFAPIFHIVQVTALPADPNPATLYIIVS